MSSLSVLSSAKQMPMPLQLVVPKAMNHKGLRQVYRFTNKKRSLLPIVHGMFQIWIDEIEQYIYDAKGCCVQHWRYG